MNNKASISQPLIAVREGTASVPWLIITVISLHRKDSAKVIKLEDEDHKLCPQ
jgi:hypothetical protein